MKTHILIGERMPKSPKKKKTLAEILLLNNYDKPKRDPKQDYVLTSKDHTKRESRRSVEELNEPDPNDWFDDIN